MKRKILIILTAIAASTALMAGNHPVCLGNYKTDTNSWGWSKSVKTFYHHPVSSVALYKTNDNSLIPVVELLDGSCLYTLLYPGDTAKEKANECSISDDYHEIAMKYENGSTYSTLVNNNGLTFGNVTNVSGYINWKKVSGISTSSYTSSLAYSSDKDTFVYGEHSCVVVHNPKIPPYYITNDTKYHVVAVAISNDGKTVAAAEDDDSSSDGGIIIISTNGGVDWTTVHHTKNTPSGIAIGPQINPGMNQIIVTEEDTWGDKGGTSIISADNGKTWNVIEARKDATNVAWFYDDTANLNIIAITTYNGVYVSTDETTTWQHYEKGIYLNNAAFAEDNITDPDHPTVYLVAS